MLRAGSAITELVGDCSDHSLDLHFSRASVKCHLESASACALGRIICMLCSISSLALIHQPCHLAAAAAATATLRCCVAYTPRALPPSSSSFSSHATTQPLAHHSSLPRPFDFVWKGHLSAEGVAQEGARRVGHGFSDMMLALQGAAVIAQDGHALHAALLDVQVCGGRRNCCALAATPT